MNTTKTFEAEMPEALPVDMRQWFDCQTIVGLVLQAQASMDSAMLNVKSPGKAMMSGQANALMAVLTYCYVCNMISSQNLEQNAQADPMIRYLCSNRLPAPEFIKRFRKQNRKQIQECLASVFQLAWQKRMNRLFLASDIGRLRPLSEHPSEPCSQFDTNKIRADGGLTTYFGKQAECLVLNAIQCDSMEMDL